MCYSENTHLLDFIKRFCKDGKWHQPDWLQIFQLDSLEELYEFENDNSLSEAQKQLFKEHFCGFESLIKSQDYILYKKLQ